MKLKGATFGLFLLWTVGMGQPTVLVVQAHPDDETACSAFLFALRHYQKSAVDICVITNGEAGYRYSTLAEQLYGIPLTNDSVGRAYLPLIRKREMLDAAQVLGIRAVYFLDERDHAYNQNLEETLSVWDTAAIVQRLERILQKGRYDFAIGLLPTHSTHGGHKAATFLLLRAVAAVAPQLPVLGVAASDSLPPLQLESFVAGAEQLPPLIFDRTASFGFNQRLNWKAVVAWNVAVHRSQGLMPLAPIPAHEYYWILSPLPSAEAHRHVEQFFAALTETLRKQLPNHPQR